jgi:MOSC domain-containing protein YiiM
MAGPVVASVNVGRPRPVPWRGQTVVTAIWKAPVAGRVPVRGVSVDGDQQGNPEVHGGVDKAVYAYAGEDADWWGEQLGRGLAPGSFGENLAEGEVAAGDPVQVVHRPAHGLAVAEVSAIYHRDRARAPRLLEAPELAEGWKEWAADLLAARAATGAPPARG